MFSEGLGGSEMSVWGRTPVWPLVTEQRSVVGRTSLPGLGGTEVQQTVGGTVKV